MGWWSKNRGRVAVLGGATVGGLLGGPTGAAAGAAIGGALAPTPRDDSSERNYAAQKEFAKMGIRWRVADAKAAGISPLAALGAGGAGFSPSFQSSEPDALLSMGQDVGRAIAATSSSEERGIAALQMKSLELDIQGKQIDNMYRARQLQHLDSGPPFPGSDYNMDGQAQSGVRVKVVPKQITASPRGYSDMESGASPDVAYTKVKHPSGVFALNPSIPVDQSEVYENDPLGLAGWQIRNRVANSFGVGRQPPRSELPSGYSRWEYDFGYGWVPTRGSEQLSKYDEFRGFRHINPNRIARRR